MTHANLATHRANATPFSWRGLEIATWSKEADIDGAAAPTLVLLHGFPTSSFDWSRVWEDLGRTYHLFAVDMVGYGLSAKPAKIAYSIGMQADLIAEFLEAKGVESCALVAHDVGATVAQELLLRQQSGALHQFRIEKICFLNAGLFVAYHRARPIQKLVAGPLGHVIARMMSRGAFGRAFTQILGKETALSAAELDDLWSLVVRANGKAVMKPLLGYIAERRDFGGPWERAVAHAQIPLQLVCGLDDPVSGAHVAEAFTDVVKTGSLIRLPGIGHYPQLEAPADVLAAVRSFIPAPPI